MELQNKGFPCLTVKCLSEWISYINGCNLTWKDAGFWSYIFSQNLKMNGYNNGYSLLSSKIWWNLFNWCRYVEFVTFILS